MKISGQVNHSNFTENGNINNPHISTKICFQKESFFGGLVLGIITSIIGNIIYNCYWG